MAARSRPSPRRRQRPPRPVRPRCGSPARCGSGLRRGPGSPGNPSHAAGRAGPDPGIMVPVAGSGRAGCRRATDSHDPPTLRVQIPARRHGGPGLLRRGPGGSFSGPAARVLAPRMWPHRASTALAWALLAGSESGTRMNCARQSLAVAQARTVAGPAALRLTQSEFFKS